MKVWRQPFTIIGRRSVLHRAGLLFVFVALITTLVFAYMSQVSHAAAGINRTLNFQARLLTSAGAVVPDGHYNVQFKIYQDGAGTTAGNTGGTLKWTETYINNGGTSGIEVKNGFLSVTLGSQTAFGTSVDWNQDTLWLSMNIAGSATDCTSFNSGSCVADGEMLPMKRISAVPYAFNAEQVGGLSASDLLQNTSSLQTASLWTSDSIRSDTSLLSTVIDTPTADDLSIGETNATSVTLGNSSATTNIQGGTTNFLSSNIYLGYSGTTSLIGSGTAGLNILSSDQTTSGTGDLWIGSGNSSADSATSGHATFSTGNVSGSSSTSGGVTIQSGANTGTGSSGNVELWTGNASSGSSGNITLDTGSGSTTNGYVSIGTTNASGVYIGKSGSTTNFYSNVTANADLVQSGSGTFSTGTGAVSLNGNITVASDKSLTLTGGSSRPGSPTEGMLWYDTTTKQLLIYTNGKWQSDGKSATKIVAASDSSQAVKDAADYVADGTSDQSEINSALTAAAGGRVYLSEGTYTIDGSISVPNNTTLAGAGNGTIIQLADLDTDINAITNTDQSTGKGLVLRDMKLDGRSNLNTSGVEYGIYLTGIGDISSNTAGAIISNMHVTGFRSMGIALASAQSVTITNNTVSNTGSGIVLGGSANSNLVTNNIVTNSTRGIYLSGASNNTISNNRLSENGGSTANDSVYISSSSSNLIVDNTITDTSHSSTNHGINITDSGSSSNYLANNLLNNSDISDTGTGTVYGGQTDASGNYTIQPASDINLNADTNITGVVTASGGVLTSTVDTAASGTLTLGGTNATSISLADNTTVTSGKTFSVNGATSVTTTNSAALLVQNAGSTALLTADTSAMQVVIGTTSNGITLSSSGLQLSGSARNTKTILLTAEYSGSVLDDGSGSNNTGTMTSSLDLTNRMNYYKWTTTQGTNQNYDVVVQVPIPADFSAWASNPLSISSYTSDTTNGTVTLEARDSSGTVQCNFVSVTPGSTSTWAANNSACTLSSGTYTAGNYLTLRIRMQSPTSGDVRIGNISLNYLSKY